MFSSFFSNLIKKIKNSSHSQRRRFLFETMYGLTMTSSIIFYFLDIFLPGLKALQSFEKLPNYDPIIAIFVLGFICLSSYFCIYIFPRWICIGIVKIIDLIYKCKNRDVSK